MVVTVLVGIVLSLPCAPAAVHAFTHSIDPEASEVHAHSGDIHRHEHDTGHHEVLLSDEIPAVIVRKGNVPIQGYTDVGLFKSLSINHIVLFLSSNHSYPVGSDPPGLQRTESLLYNYFPNAPPA